VRRAPVLVSLPLLVVALAAGPVACAGKSERSEAPSLEAPARIAGPDDFEQAINAFALMQLDHPERTSLRHALLVYITGEGHRAIAAGDDEGAADALEYGVGLYTPAELRGDRVHDEPELASLARDVYDQAARRGEEPNAVLALAVRRQFERGVDLAKLDEAWAQIENWQGQGRRFSRDPMHSGDSEQLLEEVTAVFPSPWLVARLDATYRERHRQARNLLDHGGAVGPGERHRLEYTGYKLARLHLRANDPNAAIKGLADTAIDPASVELRGLLEEVFGEPRTGRAAAELLEYFRPEDPDNMPEYAVVQGWAIVEIVARHALERFPDDPRHHVALADAFMEYGYGRAALVHYRRALDSRNDLFEAWARVAQLEQLEMELLAESDPKAALDALPRLEEFHAKAVEKWPDRPIRPSIVDAYVAVAEGLYHAGRIEPAKALVAKATKLEPLPEVLDLGGEIAFKEGRLDEATQTYRSLLTLPFDDQYDRVYWEIRARSRLGEVGLHRGDAARAHEDLQGALSELNLVLSLPDLDVDTRSYFLTERARVFFNLGEAALAMDDVRAAVSAAPTRPSVYSEPLLFCVAHGRYRDAMEVYGQAMSHPLPASLQLYFTLWVVELARRSQAPLPDGATGYLADFEGEPWLEALAAHARGELSGPDLVDRAKTPGELAEAHFYEGVRQWRSGQTDVGLDHLRKVLDTGMLSFFEYEMASDYLSWRDLPRTARSPVHEATQ